MYKHKKHWTDNFGWSRHTYHGPIKNLTTEGVFQILARQAGQGLPYPPSFLHIADTYVNHEFFQEKLGRFFFQFLANL